MYKRQNPGSDLAHPVFLLVCGVLREYDHRLRGGGVLGRYVAVVCWKGDAEAACACLAETVRTKDAICERNVKNGIKKINR